jgi:two-component system, cell cycle response regulator DivK
VLSGLVAADRPVGRVREVASTGITQGQNMSRTILIIDDNDLERDIFASFLRFAGGRVLEASDGSEGLRVAETEVPDLILLDLTMPVLDGWETIRRLKAGARTRGIPVVALTAHHLEWNRLEEVGFCGYLEKPIVPFRVLEEVECCIGPLAPDAEGSRRQSPSIPGIWRSRWARRS